MTEVTNASEDPSRHAAHVMFSRRTKKAKTSFLEEIESRYRTMREYEWRE